MTFTDLLYNGYGQFIWPAFFFTFLICFSYYLSTKKELEKQEKMLSRVHEQTRNIKIENLKRKSTAKEALLVN
tara:strand:- start:313 stop:531 length:219 start_codon:yes stop_codon:yes gene_type:complete